MLNSCMTFEALLDTQKAVTQLQRPLAPTGRTIRNNRRRGDNSPPPPPPPPKKKKIAAVQGRGVPKIFGEDDQNTRDFGHPGRVPGDA